MGRGKEKVAKALCIGGYSSAMPSTIYLVIRHIYV